MQDLNTYDVWMEILKQPVSAEAKQVALCKHFADGRTEDHRFDTVAQAAACYKFDALHYAICSRLFEDMSEADSTLLDDYFADILAEKDPAEVERIRPYLEMWQKVDDVLDPEQDALSVLRGCIEQFNAVLSDALYSERMTLSVEA